MSAAARLSPTTFRVVAALWVFGVLFELGVAWRTIHERERALAVASPVAEVVPFPIPRSRSATRRVDSLEAEADSTGLLRARGTDGQVVWSLRAPPREGASPVLSAIRAGDRLIFAAPSGVLYALDPASGAPLWATRMGDRFVGAPEASGSRVRVGVERSGERVLVSVDADTGAIIPRR